MYKTKNKQNMKRKIASTIIQLTIGPSKNFLSQIETPCVQFPHGICHRGTSSYLAQSFYLVRNSSQTGFKLKNSQTGFKLKKKRYKCEIFMGD